MKKRFLAIAGASAVALTCFVGASCKTKEKVVIYTSSEDYCMEYMQECLDEKFPDYDIRIEYMSTSNIAAKIIAEGSGSDCDIVFAEEYGYIEKMAEADTLAKLSDYYDYSVYMADTLESHAKDYLLPELRVGGGIFVNTKVLKDKGLDKPTSYNDLLDAKYKGLVSMPSPKSSGTGYMFYLALVNEWGESTAIEYFDSLTSNILSYTSSGSGPVNALVGREVAVGLGMISQVAEKISGGNDELEILFFDEGAPFNLYGNSIVKGKDKRESVKAVMDYLYSDFTDAVCAKYYPEPVLKDKVYNVPAFPKNITYSDMSNNTLAKKEDLLAKWKH
ncbi:MAG: extracellular solute-binding protein [Clostridia bacterium]|nr:extracellular solute-binding protein [Clostridia bacterium]